MELGTATGLSLGVLAGTRYQLVGSTFAPGDVLVLASDGLHEAMNSNGEPLGKPQLQQCLQLNASRALDDVRDQLLPTQRDFSGDILQQDDITILCARLCAFSRS